MTVHLAALLLAAKTGPADVEGPTVRRTLTVELRTRPSRETPGSPSPAGQIRETEQEPAEPVFAAEQPAAEAPVPAEPGPGATERLAPLDVRAFVRRYEAQDDQPDPLAFRPDLQRRLEMRRAEEDRQALVRQNYVERFGYDAESIAGLGDMTKVGDRCYAVSSPLITIQRGQHVSQVVCPGKVEWWKRDDLQSVAAFRGIP